MYKGTAPGFGELEGGRAAALPRLRNFVSRPSFKRNGLDFAILDAWYGADIRDPTERSGSWQFLYKYIDIRVYTA